MIRRTGEYTVDAKEQMRGGEGSVKIEHYWHPGTEMKAANRLFAKLTLQPGSSIGFHQHSEEEEVFVILRGAAETDDNGIKTVLNAGDTILTGNGAGHSIKCVSQEPLEVLAVISCYK
jgi:mannose-6-phosphate isomerase-like protein (cupin superfamily)